MNSAICLDVASPSFSGCCHTFPVVFTHRSLKLCRPTSIEQVAIEICGWCGIRATRQIRVIRHLCGFNRVIRMKHLQLTLEEEHVEAM
jgi:hypothetical protein